MTHPLARPRLAALAVQLAVLLAVLLGGLLAGCRAHDAREYRVRGQVRQLPVAGDPSSSFQISHEAVDDFVDRQGEVVGMDPMVMSFPLAPGVSLAGLAVGDYIDFTLRVDWKAEPAVEIREIHKLPPETRLDFRAARPTRPGTKP
jgi:hypothetical protein